MTERILSASGFPDAEISVVLVGRRAMRALNARYRGVDRVTDVLSFSQVEGRAVPRGGPLLLGDVVICADVARSRARSEGRRPRDEYARLLVHGLSHLLGHDHERPAEATRMQDEERRLLGALGVDMEG
jgi:probable rRNA maturation factor